jgi:RimJ/RimL family protein N-acetyltransferase
LNLLDRTDYERVRPLFRKMDIHLPLQAILAGNVDAPIYVDNIQHPLTALTWTGHRFYLAGVPGNMELITAARKIFLENYSTSAWKSGIESYIIHYPTEKWEDFVKIMLDQKYPIKMTRSYLHKLTRRIKPIDLPDGLVMIPVDEKILAGKWKNLDFLTEEMTSERSSVDEFIEKSFGICLADRDLIVGWCLSEYNTGHRCEVGIAIHEDYRLRGLATKITNAFVEMANSRGIARIGWHCQASNAGSIATAIKAGFEKGDDYPVFVGWFEDVTNLARNGYFAHARGEYSEALAFYEKTFALGRVPDSVYWGAACDAALIGESEKAIMYLQEAVRRGYDDIEKIENSPYLTSLHDLPEWKLLVAQLR